MFTTPIFATRENLNKLRNNSSFKFPQRSVVRGQMIFFAWEREVDEKWMLRITTYQEQKLPQEPATGRNTNDLMNSWRLSVDQLES